MSNSSLITSIAGNLKSADERTTDAFSARGMMLMAPVRTARILGDRSLTTVLAVTPVVGESPVDASVAFLSRLSDTIDVDKVAARFIYQHLTVLPVPTVKFTNLSERVRSLTDVGVVAALPDVLKNYLSDDETAALLNALAGAVVRLGATIGVRIEGLTGENLFTHGIGDTQEEFLLRLALSQIFRLSEIFKVNDLAGNIAYFAGTAISNNYVTQDVLTGTDPNGITELDIGAKLTQSVTFLHREVSAVVSTLLSPNELITANQNGSMPQIVLQTLDTMLARQLPQDRLSMIPGVEALVLIASGHGDGGLVTTPVYADIGLPAPAEKAPEVKPEAAPEQTPEQTQVEAELTKALDAITSDEKDATA